jgi:hypothetical protein
MNWVKKIEAVFIDTIAAVTPWLAPLIPAYLVYHNMTTRLGYPPIFGLIGAAAVEFLGLSAVHTAVTFWTWNDDHTKERAPFWFAFGAGLFYVAIVLTVNAALDIWQDSADVKIFAHALLSLLSVDAAIIIAVRAQHARRLADKQSERDERKAQRVAAKSQNATPDATQKQQGDTGATPDATPATRDQFVVAWRSNGHKSIAALADEMHIHPRTAQRWVEKELLSHDASHSGN